MKLVGFGYSHIISVRFAADVYKLKDYGIEVNTTLLNDSAIQPLFSNIENEDFRFSKKFSQYIDRSTFNADVIFLCVAGNAHQILGLVNHPLPFDFVLEQDPSLPLLQEHEYIPSALVAEGLMNQGGFPESIRLLNAFKSYFHDIPLFQCALPPIIPCDEHIKNFAGTFKDVIKKHGISHKLLRYKLWRLHSQLIKDQCDFLQIQYVGIPNSMIDCNGFLVKEAWPQDPTHANHLYGLKIIEQLVQIKQPSFVISNF